MRKMRKINKSTEPTSWTEYRLTPGATYTATADLRNSLLREQGYLCAYCMRRIPVRDSSTREESKIEHICSRSADPSLELDYNNMVICCPGKIDGKSHCDTAKESRNITFSLFDPFLEESIKYNIKNGLISSSNSSWNNEFNDILNLNNKLLCLNRRETIEGIINVISSKKYNKSKIRKLLEKHKERDGDGKFREYCGIVIWYLNKKMA